MIIDAYNNVWQPSGRSDYITGASFTLASMLGAMDAAGVNMAVGCSLGQQIDNGFLGGVARDYPDRLIAFAGVNPRAADAVASLHAAASLHGCRGLKLHPTMSGFHFADHGLLDPLFAACRELRWPVLVNALDDPFCAPLAIEEIARGFPEVPVLIAHMGTVWNTTEANLVAARNENIVLETSCATLLDVRTAYATVGPGKLVMGTDWPASDFDLERAKLARAIEDPDDLRLVEGENLARILGLGLEHRPVPA